MATTDTAEASPPAPKSKGFLMIGGVLAVISAGGGYYAMSQGLIPLTLPAKAEKTVDHGEKPAYAFVEIEPMLVPMGTLLSDEYLRFRAQLEVTPGEEATVQALMPRIVDVLNGYLRALERADLERPAALVPLRANMLRRVQTVVGPGKVRDLLIMEIVVN